MLSDGKTLIRKLCSTFFSSVKAGLFTSLFVLSLLSLLVLLWVQVQKAYQIALPVGQTAAPVHGQAAIPSRVDRQVLVLNSYHRGYSWSDNEMAGIIETLKEADPGIQPLIEYLDCKHFPNMEHFDRVRDLFLQKYRNRDFPAVITADNPALEFALKYRARLFSRSAIIFCGINGFNKRMLEGNENITGVAERLDAAGTMKAALELHPQTREVIVVHDYTITGQATRAETEDQLGMHAEKVTFRYLPNMTSGELVRFVRGLSPDSLVLGLSYSLDKDGQVIDHETISRLLSENSPVPVYSLHEERLGYGIVGGSLLGGKNQGARAAEMALSVLSGVPASRIPVDLKSPTRMMFDYNQLVRFGIPPRSLPRGSLIANRPVSFFTQYRGLVITTLAIILILAAGIMVLGFNIYQRKEAEGEQKKLQSQLVQAQKMEAVGHLAGGVAHDFNNILTAIMGYGNLLRKKMRADDPLKSFVDQVLGAAQRAVNLTKSLLTFSRKQVIELKPVHLNDIVTGIEKLTRSLIREDIEFKTIMRGRDLTVMADSGQIEQVLLNLCTNARDAMPYGGCLTIETGFADIDEAYRRNHLLEKSGRYGVISVSDTGIGMDDETKRQIFEPFFTTKEVGKGTGLGLSIAYGIIKQHQGMINAYSEPERGTTFKVYLPLVSAEGKSAAVSTAEESAGGPETILFAEDEAEVRSIIRIILNEAGYSVIEAVDGEDALRKFAEQGDSIQLLLSDVIMPKKNGREVYEALKAAKPGMKVLFISGYTSDLVHAKGIIGAELPFISKPVDPDRLLRKVREILDAHGAP